MYTWSSNILIELEISCLLYKHSIFVCFFFLEDSRVCPPIFIETISVLQLQTAGALTSNITKQET